MRSKYNARKVEYDGIKFDSKKECERYKVLKEQERSGEIEDLRLQEEFLLIPEYREESTYTKTGKEKKGKVIQRKCTYVADFTYKRDGETVVEDVKGYRFSTAFSLYTIKKKLMYDRYRIKVIEI